MYLIYQEKNAILNQNLTAIDERKQFLQDGWKISISVKNTIYYVKDIKCYQIYNKFFQMIRQGQSILKTFQQLSQTHKPVESNLPVTCTYGLTGSGKSTLINYLLKNSLSFNKQKGRYFIDHSNSNQVGPKIGNTMTSETRAISCYKWIHGQLMDLMGSEDTGGVGIEAYNAWMIRESLKAGLKLSIILVVSVHELQSARGVKFFQSFSRLEKLLGEELVPIKNSVYFVVSKITDEYQQQDILDILNETLDMNKHLITQHGYDMLKQVILSRLNLFFCPDDKRFSENLEIFHQNLSNITFYQLSKSLQISLSPTAQQALNQASSSITQEFDYVLSDAANKLQASVNNIVSQRNTNTNNNTINILQSIIPELPQAQVQTFNKLSQNFNIQIKINEISEYVKNYGIYSTLANKAGSLSGSKLQATINQCIQNLTNCNAQIQSEIERERLRQEQERRQREENERRQRQLEEQRRRQEEQCRRREEQERRRLEEQRRAHEENLRRQEQERIETQRRIDQQRRRQEHIAWQNSRRRRRKGCQIF